MERENYDIYYSRIKIAVTGAIIVAMLVVFPSYLVLFAGWKGPNDRFYMTCTTMVFFIISFFCFQYLRRIFKFRRPVISLNENGVIDRRINNNTIPWEAVSEIVFCTGGRQPSRTRLKIKPDMRAKLKLNEYWTSNLPYFGYIEIDTALLAMGSRRFFSLMLETFNRYKANGGGSHKCPPSAHSGPSQAGTQR